MENQYQHLSLVERERIAIWKAEGLSLREMGRRTGRHHSTLSRELSRNRLPWIVEGYLPHPAYRQAKERKQRAGKRIRLKNPMIRNYVEHKLRIGWSPEQIAGRLCLHWPHLTISHEAIYQYIYQWRPHLVHYLARRHKKRRPRWFSKKNRKPNIPYRVFISERSSLANERKEIGHWECDTLVAHLRKSAWHVLCERKSRYTQISKLDTFSAKAVRETIVSKLTHLPRQARRTVTYDNGSENAHHIYVNTSLGIQSYFCHPYHSWEKGTVENTIGLIRRFVPKKTDLAAVDKKTVKKIEKRLNHRPRKCLNFQTPAEVFKNLCGALPP